MLDSGLFQATEDLGALGADAVGQGYQALCSSLVTHQDDCGPGLGHLPEGILEGGTTVAQFLCPTR